MRRSAGPAVGLLACVLALSGCVDAGSQEKATPLDVPSSDQLVGAPVDVWFSGDSTRLCRHDIDPAFSRGLPPCDEGLEVTGVSGEELRAQLLARGIVVRHEDGVDIVPAFVVGTVSGRTFEVVSTDEERYAPFVEKPVPDPAPSFATGEEKDVYVSAQPVPQPEGCTAPAGGWRSMAGIGPAAAAAYQALHPDVLLGNGQAYVDHSTQIALLTVAADADPAQVVADLSSTYPDALCVRQSGLTAEHLRRVAADAVLTSSETVLSSGLHRPTGTFSDDPEPVFTVFATVLTEALAERASEYPDGLVELVPWFEPVTGR